MIMLWKYYFICFHEQAESMMEESIKLRNYAKLTKHFHKAWKFMWRRCSSDKVARIGGFALFQKTSRNNWIQVQKKYYLPSFIAFSKFEFVERQMVNSL